MGQAIPDQHPAVVLRSHYVHLRALLAVALVAVVGLSVAVVIVANDADEARTAATSEPANAIERGNSGTASGGTQAAPLPRRRLDGATDVAPRYDGGPNEGSADSGPSTNAPSGPSKRQAFPGEAREAGEPTRTDFGQARYDGGPQEGTRGPGR
jgi:hypothetical protein